MRKKYADLKKIKVRQSWNKLNLYQLSRLQVPNSFGNNYFQQKWKSRSLTRTYHGEQVRERQWEHQFDPRLRAVVPLNPAYLANHDGSGESRGRGSGLEKKTISSRTPYMNMAYAPLERRLDVAIHRALFASSTRQARQFVIHGGVRVNGKKMIYPGYMLNPGDMFQVEPERVMFATGAPKVKETEESEDDYSSLEDQVSAVKEGSSSEEGNGAEKTIFSSTDGEPSTRDGIGPPSGDAVAFSVEEKAERSTEDETEPSLEDDTKWAKDTLKRLLSQAKAILEKNKEDLGVKRKQELRAFRSEVRRVLSRSGSKSSPTDDLEAQFEAIKQQLSIKVRGGEKSDKGAKSAKHEDRFEDDLSISEVLDASTLTPAELSQLKDALAELRENPIDPSKPYATPWVPRDYMSAFAFVPRYLEVHPTICAAVYLRHPVARPGLAEVPTPFPEATNGLAFNWYLRRR